MKRYVLASAISAIALAIPVAAPAQQLPAPVIAVVDTNQIFAQCTACVAANGQLRAQSEQAQARATQLSQPLQAENQAIQAAVNALQGAQPDAALQQRIQAFETQRANAQRELGTAQESLERNVAFVRQQIGQRLGPIIQQVAQQRGANLAMDRNALLTDAPSLDITQAVLASLNQQLPSVNVTAPAAQQQPAQQPQQQPEGR